jgi:DNA-binding MarR family transcriptional regulator
MKTGLIIHLIGKIRDKAYQFLVKELAEHNIKGIAPSHGDIMGALYLHGELSMKKIAEMIGRDKSTITILVNKLIQLGYVQKKTDPDDCRVNRISLTDTGKMKEEDFWDISQALRGKAYKGLSSKEKELLMQLLTKVNENF